MEYLTSAAKNVARMAGIEVFSMFCMLIVFAAPPMFSKQELLPLDETKPRNDLHEIIKQHSEHVIIEMFVLFVTL